MDNETLKVPDWWPDEPIPIYHAKETMGPEMIWISCVNSLSSPFDKCYKEYMQQLVNKTNMSMAQDMCASNKPYFFTIEEDMIVPIDNTEQKVERGRRAEIASLYNDVMTEYGLTLMTNEEIKQEEITNE